MMRCVSIIFLLIMVNCGNDIVTSTYSHHLSDAWYSSKGRHLERTLSNLQTNALAKFPSSFNVTNIKALIVPHAAYSYSGVVATSAYQNLARHVFKRVIILAPLHNFNIVGVGLPGSGFLWYKSPLGHVKLDIKAIEQLKSSSELFIHNHEAHELEHSVEMQIPLIQKYCGNCKIVPLLIGSVSEQQMQDIAHCIGKLLDDTTLLVVSSDFTHYGKQFGYVPFTSNVLLNIFQLDSSLIQKIQDGDPQGFINLLQNTGATVCGKDPIAILLYMIQAKYLGDVHSYLVGYDSSALEQKNPDHCISYVSMVFSKETKDQVKVPRCMFC